MATAVFSKNSSNALCIGRRLIPRSTPLWEAAASTCSSRDVCPSPPAAGATAHQSRSISSMGQSRISQSSTGTSFVPPTYSALRNKVTMPFETGQGKYVSPYSDFFANVEAGRTSLGTTEEMEQRASELQQQCLQCGILESELRFITTSYGRFALPPYVSPGEHRVTVKVALSAIPFENEREKDVFIQIVGSRYDPKKGDLQLSSEKFASRIENKRYLVDMIERIVSNARELAKEFASEDEMAGANAN